MERRLRPAVVVMALWTSLACASAGVTAVGFNFVPTSPRHLPMAGPGNVEFQ